MKILFLSHKFYPEIGGIEVNSEILANEFFNAGHEVILITWTQESGTRNFPFVIIRNPGIFKLLREHHSADLVFENNPCLRLAWPSLIFGKPHVLALCTWIKRSDGRIAWQDKLKIWWLKKADAVIAVSEAVRIESWPKSIVIRNPYSHNKFRLLQTLIKRCDFVFLGRLVSDKGAVIALNAFHQIFKQQKVNQTESNYLTIIGDGPELNRLKNQASEMGIAENVIFTGALKGDELVNCLNRHKFLLVPSMWKEPFGNVALEGMACGCIPIVSDGGGLVDAVGNAGLSFERGNVDSLVECINRVETDNNLKRLLYDAAPAHLAKHYPLVVAGEYLSVFQSIVDKPKSN